MDNTAFLSERSVSSVSTSVEQHDLNNGPSSTKNENEFVNHGLLLWNQTRQQWLGVQKVNNRPQQDLEPRIRSSHFPCHETFLTPLSGSWNATYESLLGTIKCFAQPISLSEMVDFLVDIWEQEGMYD